MSKSSSKGCEKSRQDDTMEASRKASIGGHDLRRGAAQEIANLEHKPAGVANAAVASSSGHSRRSLANGVTDTYVGPNSTDFWEARVADP